MQAHACRLIQYASCQMISHDCHMVHACMLMLLQVTQGTSDAAAMHAFALRVLAERAAPTPAALAGADAAGVAGAAGKTHFGQQEQQQQLRQQPQTQQQQLHLEASAGIAERSGHRALTAPGPTASTAAAMASPRQVWALLSQHTQLNQLQLPATTATPVTTSPAAAAPTVNSNFESDLQPAVKAVEAAPQLPQQRHATAQPQAQLPGAGLHSQRNSGSGTTVQGAASAFAGHAGAVAVGSTLGIRSSSDLSSLNVNMHVDSSGPDLQLPQRSSSTAAAALADGCTEIAPGAGHALHASGAGPAQPSLRLPSDGPQGDLREQQGLQGQGHQVQPCDGNMSPAGLTRDQGRQLRSIDQLGALQGVRGKPPEDRKPSLQGLAGPSASASAAGLQGLWPSADGTASTAVTAVPSAKSPSGLSALLDTLPHSLRGYGQEAVEQVGVRNRGPEPC